MKKLFSRSTNIVDVCLKNSSQATPIESLDNFFEQYSLPKNQQSFTNSIMARFEQKLASNEIAHFFVLARHVIFKDTNNVLINQIKDKNCKFDDVVKKSKVNSPITPLLRHFANHLNDVVHLYSTQNIILCSKPFYSEENSVEAITKTLSIIETFCGMFETLSWLDWGSSDLYDNELKITLTDLLLRDFSIIFYHYAVHFAVVINNYYNYLENRYNQTLALIAKYDDFIQQFYGILRKQKVVPYDQLPQLVFMPVNPLVNFTKAWKKYHDAPEKRPETDQEIDEFVKSFMCDNKKNLQSLERFISREGVVVVKYDKKCSVCISPVDPLIRDGDSSPVYHEVCTSPFRSKSAFSADFGGVKGKLIPKTKPQSTNTVSLNRKSTVPDEVSLL